eukprot:Sdes_comp20641_c0_seq1m15821
MPVLPSSDETNQDSFPAVNVAEAGQQPCEAASETNPKYSDQDWPERESRQSCSFFRSLVSRIRSAFFLLLQCLHAICNHPFHRRKTWNVANTTRFSYVIMYSFFTFCGLVMVRNDFFIDSLQLQKYPLLTSHCAPSPHDDKASPKRCIGTLLVYRMMFASSIFHLGMAVLLFGVKRNYGWRASFHNGWWLVKFVLILGLMLLSPFYWFPACISYLRYIALFGAFLFVFLQFHLLLFFSQGWSLLWVSFYQMTDRKGWFWALILSSLAMYSLILVIFLLLFLYFLHIFNTALWINVLLISISFSLVLLLLVVSIIPSVRFYNPSNGLISSACISLYSTYFLWSALSSEASLDISKKIQEFGGSFFTMEDYSACLGLLLTLLPLGYYALLSVVQITLIKHKEWKYLPSVIPPNSLLSLHDHHPLIDHPLEASPLLSSSQDLETTSRLSEASFSSSVSEDGYFYDIYSQEGTPSRPGATLARQVTREDPLARCFCCKRNIGEVGYFCGYDYCVFHAVFALASMYCCMQLTGWSRFHMDANGNYSLEKDVWIVYVKISLGWLTSLLYFITLLVPVLTKKPASSNRFLSFL